MAALPGRGGVSHAPYFFEWPSIGSLKQHCYIRHCTTLPSAITYYRYVGDYKIFIPLVIFKLISLYYHTLWRGYDDNNEDNCFSRQ